MWNEYGDNKELNDGVVNDLEVAFQESFAALGEELEQITSFESSNGSSSTPAVYDEDDLDDDDSGNVDHLRNELKGIKTSPIYERRRKDDAASIPPFDVAGEMMVDQKIISDTPNAFIGDIGSDSSFSTVEDFLDEDDMDDNMMGLKGQHQFDNDGNETIITPSGNSEPDDIMLSKETKKLELANSVSPPLLDIEASNPSPMENEANDRSLIDRSLIANYENPMGEAVGDILVIGDSDSEDSSFSYPGEFRDEDDSPMKENVMNKRNLPFDNRMSQRFSSRPDPPSWNFAKKSRRATKSSPFTIGVGGDGYSSQLPTPEEYWSYSDHSGHELVSSRKRQRKCSKKCILLVCVVVLLPSVLVPLLMLQSRFARVEEVVVFLVQNDISTEVNLRNRKSPQNKAAKWIANTDSPHVTPSMDNDFLDRYVLAVMYFALGGDISWAHSLNFLEPEHVCSWGKSFNDNNGNELVYGVTECHDIDNKRVPVGLSMAFQSLSGTLPDELRFLTGLETLVLQYNSELEGEFPSSIRSLQNLRRLSLEHCSLTGTLPEWLYELKELTTLGLGNNLFSGAVPPSIATMTNLRSLGLDDNELVADLSLFGPLSNLEYLYLDSNEILGEVSSSLLEQWGKLRELDVSRNQISGKIPETLFSHKQLRVVDLHGNRIQGAIPDLEVEVNGSLQYLALHDNFLSKRIPTTMGFLVALKHLDLSFNNLTGTLPNTLENIFNLEYLFAGDNNFEPEAFPQFLLDMDMLSELSLRGINLTGTLPNAIDSLSSLRYLDLSQNELKGTIPASVGMLRDLEYLLLESNQFSGTLPQKLSQLGNLQTVLLEQNKLEGDTDMLCEGSSTENIGILVSDCEEPTMSCACCTICCLSTDTGCNSIDFGRNVDLKWEFGYRSHG
ncbi:unnamed protein product [Cylindrotheca closterium]|uniref:Uncharacterized protein n=1 Tax=Cylindrotheca closterium TaxID=2856 RepID=A0AAD2G0V7_9STRA|nr:unnamed protein product [Cylindrotheca closterium]